jgi:hypothetical protein
MKMPDWIGVVGIICASIAYALFAYNEFRQRGDVQFKKALMYTLFEVFVIGCLAFFIKNSALFFLLLFTWNGIRYFICHKNKLSQKP